MLDLTGFNKGNDLAVDDSDALPNYLATLILLLSYSTFCSVRQTNLTRLSVTLTDRQTDRLCDSPPLFV